VQDVLVDRKVPRRPRCDPHRHYSKWGDRVGGGTGFSDPFRVTPLTTSVVVLTLRR
jgi:hypothetical protein